MSTGKLGVRQTARKKPMLQSWPLQSEEEDGGEEEPASDSEDEVRGSHSFDNEDIR
jgi:hypothetical protein